MGLIFQLWRGGVVEKAKERKEALLLLIIRCGHVDVDHFSKGIRGGLG